MLTIFFFYLAWRLYQEAHVESKHYVDLLAGRSVQKEKQRRPRYRRYTYAGVRW